jgi:hypothetical protein
MLFDTRLDASHRRIAVKIFAQVSRVHPCQPCRRLFNPVLPNNGSAKSRFLGTTPRTCRVPGGSIGLACPWRTNRVHTAAGVKPEWASFALASTQNLQSAEIKPHRTLKVFSLAAWDADFLVRFGCVIIIASDCKHRETAVPSASCL